MPFKRYAIGSVFRGERPAKGRFREFVQCDFDTVGTESAVADAETAQVIHAALSAAGVPAFTITLNNRKILDGLLDTLGVADKTGAGPPGARQARQDRPREGARRSCTGERGRREPPGRACSDRDQARAGPRLRRAGAGRRRGPRPAPRRRSAIDPPAAEGIANLRTIFDLLDAAGVPPDRLQIDLGLARGLDYYTGVVFETTVNGWEQFGSISSGGRYDNLASLFTDRRLPGVGASIGLDRLLALDGGSGLARRGRRRPPRCWWRTSRASTRRSPVRLAARLRAAGIGAEVFPDPIQIGKQMGYGSTRGHKLAVIVGPDEHAPAALQPPRPRHPAGAEGDPLGRPGDPGRTTRCGRSRGRADERR